MLLFLSTKHLHKPTRYLYNFSTSRNNNKDQLSLRLPSFSHFPLHSSITAYLEARDLHTPTFIQYALLSKLHSLKPETVLKTNYHIVSPTGSGKTLAYLLPLINQLKLEEDECKQILTKPQRPRAVIITSNKQLVLQARNVAKDISHFAKLKCEGLGIGRSLNQQRQVFSAETGGIDILITPYTRFKRMLDRREIFLSMVRWVVVDEVDTLFQGQKSTLQDLFETIISPKVMMADNIPTPTQLILSSTTNPLKLREFFQSKLNKKVQLTINLQSEENKNPKKYQVKFQQLVDKNVHLNLQNIKHQFLHCHELNKHEILLEEIKRDLHGKIMVFCNTVASLHDLEYFLAQEGVPLITLHSQLAKNVRLNNYQLFRDAEKGVLLATDLGARGLDFPKLKKIINYDFPMGTCDYLQRAGRTGRAGSAGTVVSLYFKKNLLIINELKGASFNQPLKINNSAYGFRNREQSHHSNKFTKSKAKKRT